MNMESYSKLMSRPAHSSLSLNNQEAAIKTMNYRYFNLNAHLVRRASSCAVGIYMYWEENIASLFSQTFCTKAVYLLKWRKILSMFTVTETRGQTPVVCLRKKTQKNYNTAVKTFSVVWPEHCNMTY